MKWLLFGGAAVGALWLLSRANGGDTNPAFGMGYYGGFPGEARANTYGMAMYGGFSDSNLAPRGFWKPSMLERYQ